MVQHYSALNRPTAPVCSVCVANYNGAHMLAECLDSVLMQDLGASVEIIVHDDASIDDSVAFLRRSYPQVEILASAENVGFCIGNNRMVAHARGEFVLLLNNDAALQPGALALLLREAGSIGSCILTLPQYDMVSGTFVDRGCLLDMFYNPVPNLDSSRDDVAMVIGACLFLQRALWNELGGFPEWMGSIGEDMYLCCRARLLGHSVIALNESGYRHRRGASFSGVRDDVNQLVSTYRRRHLSERNKTAVLYMCTPTPLMWALLALHVLLLVVEGLVLAGVKRDIRIWHDIYGAALGDIWVRRQVLGEARGEIQLGRVVGVAGYLRTFTMLPWKLRMLWRHGMPTIRR